VFAKIDICPDFPKGLINIIKTTF